MKRVLPLGSFYIVASLVFSVTSFRATAQSIDASLAAYADKYSPERAYLHYDKAAYAAGDTIWFKAYLLNEIIPATDSKSLYIDFIDDKGKILSHTVSPLVDAVTNGQFDIPNDYSGSSIHILAYTRWMLNFDSSFLYNKDLRIIRKETKAGAPSPIIPTLTFFPEGGDAIAGLPTRIAFKVNDQWGRPVKIKGIVRDNANKLVDSLRIEHDGMGVFNLMPVAGQTYTASWEDEKHVGHTTALPAIKASGAVLQVNILEGMRQFVVNASPDVIAANDSVHLIGTMYQHEVFRVSKLAAALPTKGSIPLAALPSGILTITLFDRNWNPLAERITYVNNDDYRFEPAMEVTHWGLNKRARNEITISVPDSLVADLSISVTDAGIATDSSTTIISHFLLASELKGQVYNSAYYFSPNNALAEEHLELVMMTHGWRRFNWQQIARGNIPEPKYAKDTSYLTLSGKAYGVMPGQVDNNSTVVLLIRQKNAKNQMLLLPVEKDGSFSDPNLILFDTAQIYYQFPKKGGLHDASAKFMTNRMPPFASSGYLNRSPYGAWPDTSGSYRQWLLSNEANSISELQKVKTLDEVIVKSKGKSPLQIMDEKYASGLFSGGDSYNFNLVDDPFAAGSLNIFNYLEGKVAGLQVNNSGGTPTLTWRGGSPQLYLDEVQTDPDFISSLPVNDVAYIKVFRPPFLMGSNGANGAIAIYTRRGGDEKSTPGKGLNNDKVYGYSAIRQFYTPTYSAFAAPADQRDVRTTLYWNPAVILTPQKRTMTLTFFNNDISQSFHVVIEGMTKDGRLAHLEQTME